MPTPVDDQDYEQRARALLEARTTDRINAVRGLAQARQAQTDTHARVRDELAAVDRQDSDAWAGALRAGWTPDELKTVGFDAPGKKPAGRPRRTRPSTPRAPAPARDEVLVGAGDGHGEHESGRHEG